MLQLISDGCQEKRGVDSESVRKMEGKEDLKPQQEDVIRSFVQGIDVFAALPTGYGESHCYAILFDSLRGNKDAFSINLSSLLCMP